MMDDSLDKKQDKQKLKGQSGNDNDDHQLMDKFYVLSSNSKDIFRHYYSDKKSQKVFTLKDNLCKPKVAFTQKGKVFLIGGSKDNGQTDLLNTNYQLIFKKKNAELE